MSTLRFAHDSSSYVFFVRYTGSCERRDSGVKSVMVTSFRAPGGGIYVPQELVEESIQVPFGPSMT